MTVHLPDCQMQNLLQQARRYGDETNFRKSSPSLTSVFSRSGSVKSESNKDVLERSCSIDRRLSEAGVNRRASASNVLNEDTDSFIIGDRVFVDGIKPGRIQFIGNTKFGSGDWAGVVLNDPLGKNDGSVANIRYFQCDKLHGVFSRLFRLTREPIEGAEEVLKQMKKYGYEVADICRRGSVSTDGGSRRGSLSLSDEATGRRQRSIDRSSLSPRRDLISSYSHRFSPDTCDFEKSASRRPSSGLGNYEIRRSSLASSVTRDTFSSKSKRSTPVRSPLASPSSKTRNSISIEKDPNIGKLASEARRLSMERNAERTGRLVSPDKNSNVMKTKRRGSEQVHLQPSSMTDRKPMNKRSSLPFNLNQSRSETDGHNPECALSRKSSSEADARRRQSNTSVLNDNVDSLRVGMMVWVDGIKAGRIAYIGSVHFAKGVLAGIHLTQPIGKNNGSVGGHMYFQCEPKHGIFSRLHKLSLQPVVNETDEE